MQDVASLVPHFCAIARASKLCAQPLRCHPAHRHNSSIRWDNKSQHMWLQGDVSDRGKGRPLSLNVVQRIQRFGRSGALKRSVLELMALELAEEDRSPVRVGCRHCRVESSTQCACAVSAASVLLRGRRGLSTTTAAD